MRLLYSKLVWFKEGLLIFIYRSSRIFAYLEERHEYVFRSLTMELKSER